MTYSVAQLETLFTNANEGFGPDGVVDSALSALAQQDLAGSLTDAETLDRALHIAPPADGSVGSNTPEDTTDVALAVYQFFTGYAPTLAGLDYLVNGGGNPDDLDSAYYAGFNQANRYYNFAINLISGNPAAEANFAQTYGNVTFDQAVSAAYEAVVGAANVGAAQAQAAIAAIEAQQPYFQQLASELAPNVTQDLVVKAIMVAYILEEGVKADVGYYASAIDQFTSELATGATVPGETAGGVNILTGQAYTALNLSLGDEPASVQGFAGPGYTDVISGGAGDVTVIGTVNGGNTDVTLGNGVDRVNIYSGTHNVVSVGGYYTTVVNDYSSGTDTINVVNDYYGAINAVGPGDFTVNVGLQGNVSLGSGHDTVAVFAGGSGYVTLGTGPDIVSYGSGGGGWVDLSLVPASFASPTSAVQPSLDASKLDVISGLGPEITLLLPAAAAHDTLHSASNLAGAGGEALLAAGTLSGGSFTLNPSGGDLLLTYDDGTGGFVSVVLVGVASEIGHATLSTDPYPGQFNI